MGDAQRIVGGLLSGAGEGILEKAKADRAETLLRMAQEHSEGLVASTITGPGGNVHALTRGGDVKDLGIKDYKAIVDGLGLSARDTALINAAAKPETTDSGSLEGKTTNWAAVAERLIKRGRPDLAKLVGPMEGAASGITDPFDPLYMEAKKKAENWASDTAGWTTSDKEDFKQWGTKTEAIQQKTMEFYNQLKSGGRGSPAAAATVDTQYKTDRDVKQAYLSGKLTRDQAAKILREQFGNE